VNWIPCLSSIHVRSLMNIVIATNAQVSTLHFTSTSLIFRHVPIFRTFSVVITSNKPRQHTWIKFLIKYINSSGLCIEFLCKTPEDDVKKIKKILLIGNYMWTGVLIVVHLLVLTIKLSPVCCCDCSN